MSDTNDDYQQFYLSNCRKIDFGKFAGVKSKIKKFLRDDNCPPEMKILFGEYFFKKIYMNYKPNSRDKEKLYLPLIPAIEKCENTIIKGEYLHFHDYEVLSELAFNFYTKPFTNKQKFFILQMLNDIQLVKNYVQNPNISDEGMKNHFIKWLKSSPMFIQQSNLLDVLLKYYPGDEEVLEIYNDMRFNNDNGMSGGGRGTLYQDEQNVHDEDINESVLQAVGKLLEWNNCNKPSIICFIYL